MMIHPNTELAKKVCPRLRDLATAQTGGITQPRTTFFGQLCRNIRNFVPTFEYSFVNY